MDSVEYTNVEKLQELLVESTSNKQKCHWSDKVIKKYEGRTSK